MTNDVLAPPTTSIGPTAWLRRNLFSSVFNSLLTVLVGAALVWVAVTVGQWALTEARWEAVTRNLRLFLIGQYPAEQAWRLWASLLVLSVLSGVSTGAFGRTTRVLAVSVSAFQGLLAVLMLFSTVGPLITAGMAVNAALVWAGMAVGYRRTVPRRALVIAWLLSIPVTYILVGGVGIGPLPTVSTNAWGGLLLTILLAAVGIVLSFPLGVLLALGRRSALPAIKIISTAYIELIRGVPLVTILFMADVMLPFFLPGEIRIERVARAMGGITLFSAAYVAENVRGGLQAIPSGQIEAAQALGLRGWQTNLYIVLPQALRSVIPANVGLFISLLKDTTLVAIIGLSELLGIGQAVLAQSEFLGAHLEVFSFVGAVFFILCYAMSQASYRLEAAMGVGQR
ncbi:MAG TPA: amino acid ABC transporter permease [candidate division Zixibacteria bacterium]|nr:amino acid ABC transporter permease [candidate division Zixibacteria bacterium]